MQILNQDIEFLEENRTCSYFDDNISDMRYKYMYSCSEEQYQGMLERGWRRFGRMHFVPECKACTKCVSMRIDVANYKFSKSEKRVIAKNKPQVVLSKNLLVLCTPNIWLPPPPPKVEDNPPPLGFCDNTINTNITLKIMIITMKN